MLRQIYWHWQIEGTLRAYLSSSLSYVAYLIILHAFLSSADFFQNQTCRNTIRLSSSLDPDQAQHVVGSDLGPYCLLKLSADNTARLKEFSTSIV